MTISSVTDDSFQAEVLDSEQPVLVDFTAAWCPPCRVMKPVLDELAAERPDLRGVQLDVDAHQQAAPPPPRAPPPIGGAPQPPFYALPGRRAGAPPGRPPPQAPPAGRAGRGRRL